MHLDQFTEHFEMSVRVKCIHRRTLFPSFERRQAESAACITRVHHLMEMEAKLTNSMLTHFAICVAI